MVASASREAATCIVLAGAVADAASVARVRAVAAGAPIVVVARAAVPLADVVVSPRANGRGRLAAVVRYLLGEPVRASPRVAAAGWVRLDDAAAAVALVDVAEGGVRVRGLERPDGDEHRLTLATADGLAVTARARLIRHHGDDEAVFGFIGLGAGDHQRLRGWLARASGSRAGG